MMPSFGGLKPGLLLLALASATLSCKPPSGSQSLADMAPVGSKPENICRQVEVATAPNEQHRFIVSFAGSEKAKVGAGARSAATPEIASDSESKEAPVEIVVNVDVTAKDDTAKGAAATPGAGADLQTVPIEHLSPNGANLVEAATSPGTLPDKATWRLAESKITIVAPVASESLGPKVAVGKPLPLAVVLGFTMRTKDQDTGGLRYCGKAPEDSLGMTLRTGRARIFCHPELKDFALLSRTPNSDEAKATVPSVSSEDAVRACPAEKSP